jgi:hypothetical protein
MKERVQETAFAFYTRELKKQTLGKTPFVKFAAFVHCRLRAADACIDLFGIDQNARGDDA